MTSTLTALEPKPAQSSASTAVLALVASADSTIAVVELAFSSALWELFATSMLMLSTGLAHTTWKPGCFVMTVWEKEKYDEAGGVQPTHTATCCDPIGNPAPVVPGNCHSPTGALTFAPNPVSERKDMDPVAWSV